ncbi:MAG: hypothetical protein DMD94_00220 [Candidatus Rokuibacteriota bacterium]|nr:MAG: hypothetical protein DMD94_00220 [Candidatus Rokubacteria bacterium]
MALAAGAPASAWVTCDFLTGGGFIVRDSGAKGNFGIGGSCRPGGDGHGLWGHLEYHDHGTGLNVHWLTITAYVDGGDDGTDPKTHQPKGTRIICGTARTNQFGDVDWAVRAKDVGEPGVDDEFVIQLSQGSAVVYTTLSDSNHTLGGTGPGGGNIQLHKPNPSITESFTELNPTTCPAFYAS